MRVIWFWGGLSILIVMAACNSVATPTSTQPRATFTPIPVTQPPTLPPVIVTSVPAEIIPSPTPTCGQDAPPTHMIVGEHGWMSDDDFAPLNVRAVPGTIDTRIVGRLQTHDVFFVLDGPQCAEKYVWYYIQHGDLFGWVAEGDAAGYYISPYLPG